ncbi:MAG: hypothetical protein SNI51_02275 [Rikenellaceae bacterium]
MMKKILIGAVVALSVAACSESKSSATLDGNLVVGTWIFTTENEEEVTTNGYFACRFDGSQQDYSAWCDLGDGNSCWIYKDDVDYTIVDDLICVYSSTDDIRVKTTISADENGDYNIINWTETVNIDGGVDMYDNRSYSGYRSTVDYATNITEGIWEGRATEGRTTNPYLRIEYHSDNTYDFQSRNSEDEEWSDKADNDGHYYILGELLGNVWVNDLNSDIEGSMSEAWIVEIEGDTMIWNATREGGATEQFKFTRVLE